jgi:hypothetical protein
MPKTLRYLILAIIVVASMTVLAACGSSNNNKTKTATPTAAPTKEATATTEATTAPTAEATTEPTVAPTKAAPATTPTTEAAMAAPTTEAAAVPDWATMGFTNILAMKDFTPGTALTITADPYTVAIPADAFSQPVVFEVLSGDVTALADKAPSGETPVLAFAFRVSDKQTGALIGTFDKPVTLTAKSDAIVATSVYYNLAPDGTYTANPTGLTVRAGTLSHPVAGAGVAWVITAPAQ